MLDDPPAAESSDPAQRNGQPSGATAIADGLDVIITAERPAARVRPAARSARRLLRAGLGAVAVSAAALAGLALGLRPPDGRILPGVSVWGVAVGSMTADAARSALAERVLPVLDRRVALVDGHASWSETPRALGCSYDADAMASSALSLGRRGTIVRRTREAWRARRHGLELRPRRHINRGVLAQRLHRIAAQAHVPARDARVRFNGRVFLVAAEQVGRAVDAEETERNIVRYFEPMAHRSVKLVARQELPRVTASEARKVNARLASFPTAFSSGNANRTENLRLAAQKLNGALVPAGAVFSYNDTVGPRTEELGYRVAKIFRKGRILDGVGGGVCQVATTLYNAVLESHLPVLERARHSRPVTYVAGDRDATVSFGGVDLKFRNSTTAPVLIQTRAGGGTLIVSMYGNERFKPHRARRAGAVRAPGSRRRGRAARGGRPPMAPANR